MTSSECMQQDLMLIEEALNGYFTGSPAYVGLYDAMRYSLLAGGKRIRPVLVMESCRACGGDPEKAIPFACALEMVHTYSLIHDDLPCMDNDDYRRGRLTNHKIYGEAGATLAGDALLTAAFETLSDEKAQACMSSVQIAAACKCLARAAGEDGMVAGQMLDLKWEAEPVLSEQQFELMYSLKTGALLRCACELGRIAANGTAEQADALLEYASALGYAFQIRDDILDITSTDEELGKPVGSDAEQGKLTLAGLLGVDAAQNRVRILTDHAVHAAGKLQHPEFLQWLAEELVGRRK